MKKLFALFSIFTLSGPVFAAYGPAGCGFGSMLFQEEPQTKLTAILEASTNGSTFTQSFGISSDSSNCIDAKTVYGSMKIQMYIDSNRVALAKDISRGDGEALNGLTRIFQCHDEAVGLTLQKRYEIIFPEPDVPAAKVDKSIRSILRGNSRCQNLG